MVDRARHTAWADSAGATTFEYAVMVALILFALVLFVIATVADRGTAAGSSETCDATEVACPELDTRP
jgi:Flp pilus assembly pilin Flp